MADTLRGLGLERPTVDGAVVAQVRAELEAAVQGAQRLEHELRVTKGRIGQVLLCERHLVARLGAPDPGTPEMVAGRLADQLFGLVAVGQVLGPDLVADALGAARAAGDRSVGPAWEALSAEERVDATTILEGCLAALSNWPALPGNALMRLQEPLRAELAGGHVVLAGRADLVLGRPSAGVAGSTLVDVKSGRRRHDDTADAGWYAVLETLRHRAPPFQVGSYYLRDGVLAVEVATPELLSKATERIAQGLRRLVRLAQGGSPEATPNPLCPWCPAIDSCEPGRRFSSERGDLVGCVSAAGAGGLDDEDLVHLSEDATCALSEYPTYSRGSTSELTHMASPRRSTR